HRAWQASCPPRSLPGRYRGDRNRQSAPCHTSGRPFPRTGGSRAFGGARAALALLKIRELRSGLPRDLRSEASPAHYGPIVWFGRLPFLSSTRPRHLSNSRIPPLAKGGGTSPSPRDRAAKSLSEKLISERRSQSSRPRQALREGL